MKNLYHYPICNSANAVLLGIILISIGLNQQVNASYKLYLSHIGLTVFIVYTFFFLILRAYNRTIIFKPHMLLVLVFLLVYSSTGYLHGGERFGFEFAKLAFNILIFISMVLILENSEQNFVSILYSIVAGMLISIVFFIKLPLLSDVNISTRLNPVELGGFNGFGGIVAIASLCVIYLIHHVKNGKVIQLFSLGILIYTLMATMSRTAFLSLIIGFMAYLVFSGKTKFLLFSMLTIIVGFVILYGSEANPITERFFNLDSVKDGSGRLQVWSFLINEMLSSSGKLLFGSGVGNILTKVIGGSTDIQSSHSILLYVLYSFGIIVAFIFYGFLALIFIRMYKDKNNPFRAILLAMFVQIMVQFMFDSQAMSSQIGWIYPLWLALFYSSKCFNRYERAHVETHGNLICSNI